MKGTYILIIFVNKPCDIIIGALGKIRFDKGYYFYVGSAMGEKGSTSLIGRVKRHVSESKQKKIRWHIDYFLKYHSSKIQSILLVPSTTRYECTLANSLLETADCYIKDFGSSDCHCLSHLFYFHTLPKTYL